MSRHIWEVKSLGPKDTKSIIDTLQKGLKVTIALKLAVNHLNAIRIVFPEAEDIVNHALEEIEKAIGDDFIDNK